MLVAGLAATALWSSRADYGLLYGGLSDTEAAKVVAALDDAKVPYKVGSGGAIMVPPDKVYAMRMQLASKGIPQGDGVGFEIFDKPNFGISDFVQRANYLRALQGELARTISQIDEVERGARDDRAAGKPAAARQGQISRPRRCLSACAAFRQLQPQTINSIRFLVANSVEGLKPNHVAVVDNLGNVLSRKFPTTIRSPACPARNSPRAATSNNTFPKKRRTCWKPCSAPARRSCACRRT